MKKIIILFFLVVVFLTNKEFEAYSQNNTVSDYFPDIKILASNKPSEGYFFFGTKGLIAPNSEHYIAIIDNYGTPVFFRKMDERTSSMRLLNDGRIAYMYDSPRRLGLFFLDDKLTVLDSLDIVDYKPDGHDWAFANDGHFLLMGKNIWIYDMSQIVVGGNTEAQIVDLIVQEFDENFNLLYTWNSADHFEITDGNENSPYLDLLGAQIDYVHPNGISVDSDTSFLISSRHMDEITKVDRRNGDIIWRLGGEKNQFQFINDDLRFSHQHSIRKLENGNILLFDNGNLHPTQVSAAVEYQLDEKNKTATLIKRYNRDSLVYSNHGGSVQGLQNGNILTGWGSYWPSFTEFHPDGSTALEWDFTKHSFSPRIEKYVWETKIFETSEDTIEFTKWESDTLKAKFWIFNNVSEEILITTVDQHTTYFGISETLPVSVAVGDSVKVTCWFNPINAESGYLTDVLTLAYDTENERIARQVKVVGWKNDDVAPEAQLVSTNAKIASEAYLEIQFSEPIRNANGTEFDFSSIDDYVILNKSDAFGNDVDFNASISSDNTLLKVNLPNLENESNYYIALKSGIADFSGNDMIPFSDLFSTVSTNSDKIDSKESILIFPNPVQSILNIRLNNANSKGQLKIYNQTGQLVILKETFSVNSWEIDCTNFESGFYFLTYENEKGIYTEKIIKY